MVKSRAKVEEFSRLRSKRRSTNLIIFIFVLVILIAGTLFVLLSKSFLISEIKVQGVLSISENLIEQKAKEYLEGRSYLIFPKKNIILYPGEEIEAAVTRLSHKIESTDVYRSGLDKITVSIIERTPEYLWCTESASSSDCYFVDGKGVVYSEAPIFSDPVYVEFYDTSSGATKKLGESFVAQEIFLQLVKLTELLHDEKIEVKKIYLEEYGDLTVVTNQEYEIRFNLSISVADSVKNLRLSLASENLETVRVEQKGGLKYIDLRFDKKVYYKFNNE